MAYLSQLVEILPSAALAAAFLVILFVTHRLLNRHGSALEEHQFRNQVLMLVLTVAGILAVSLSLPVSDATRSQLLGLFGVLLSAMIALSSTTFVGNALAGMMLRSLRHFRAGDFIRVGKHFGRVSERGLFHVEIQTEDRDLTTLPNLYLVTQPVTVVRATGTIVSATVSLGYDVSREVAEELLSRAADRAALEEHFVHVLELGDFSVTYRVAGLLADVKRLLSARSRLREMILDELHAGGVEIVSPSFMNQRVLAKDQRFVPSVADVSPVSTVAKKSLETLAFDKADEAETLARLQEHLATLEETIASKTKELEQSGDSAAQKALARELSRLRERHSRVQTMLESFADAKE